MELMINRIVALFLHHVTNFFVTCLKAFDSEW